jgi:hypothetical protein
MNPNTPLSPRHLSDLADVRRRVLSSRQLREHGITAATATERCRPGGPWQRLLPGVYLLHPGPPTGEERLHGALLYGGRPPSGTVPEQGRPVRPGSTASPYGEAMVTGLAALTLHGFACAPPLPALDQVDVLVPRTRRLRSTGHVHIIRERELPRPVEITGVPCAPVPRALADAIGQLTDAAAVRRLLTRAVRGGHCDAGAVVRELTRARLLGRPYVVDAVDALIAEGRSMAEERLYELVRLHDLPEPLWNVELRLPGGPHLGGLDAYWPDHAVALEIDARTPRHDADALWTRYARKRETLERLGITVVHLTPKKLREVLDQQAEVVRAALLAAAEREPAAYVVVLPR